MREKLIKEQLKSSIVTQINVNIVLKPLGQSISILFVGKFHDQLFAIHKKTITAFILTTKYQQSYRIGDTGGHGKKMGVEKWVQAS